MAGRPKKTIKKDDLYGLLYIYKQELFFDPKYQCETKLISLLDNIDLEILSRDKAKYDEFKLNNIKLINQCEYKLKERRKNNEIIKYLKSIPSEKLKPIENKILNIYENFNTLTSDEYFNLQKQLNNYRSHHSEMIKNSVSKNMVSPEDKTHEQEKIKARKTLNNEKFFLGGAFLSLYREFFSDESPSSTDALSIMIKVFYIYKFNAQHDPKLANLFEKYRHLPPFLALENKLDGIKSDSRNPMNKETAS